LTIETTPLASISQRE